MSWTSRMPRGAGLNALTTVGHLYQPKLFLSCLMLLLLWGAVALFSKDIKWFIDLWEREKTMRTEHHPGICDARGWAPDLIVSTEPPPPSREPFVVVEQHNTPRPICSYSFLFIWLWATWTKFLTFFPSLHDGLGIKYKWAALTYHTTLRYGTGRLSDLHTACHLTLREGAFRVLYLLSRTSILCLQSREYQILTSSLTWFLFHRIS